MWLKNGDNNTRFFHRYANQRHKRNLIKGLMENGVWVSDHGGITRVISKFYKDLISDPYVRRPVLEGLDFKNLPSEWSEWLERPFTEVEITQALKCLKEEKAPGPDGFPIRFYIEFWNVLGNDVSRALEEFHSKGALCRSLNSSFITLIPKKPQPVDIRDYWPISLLNSFYKLLSKVLALRMEEVMGFIISPTQCAFVKGRQLLDCSLIANESIDFWLKSNFGGLVCHVDMGKAYDHVNWGFLDWALKQMGFGKKLRFWVRVCISLASYSLLVNGTSTGLEKGQRGLRQGDPISPFLFNIVMEVLDCLVARAVEVEGLSGCKFRDEELSISILQFADNSLFFIPKKMEEIKNIWSILLLFETISGLRINLPKSKLYAIPFENRDALRYARMLKCQVASLPVTNLGLPLGGSRKARTRWDPVVERVHQRLTGRKGQYLSKGGKLTLIRSVLSNLLVYFMSFFRAPSSILHQIDRLRRAFLWNSMDDEKRFHLVA